MQDIIPYIYPDKLVEIFSDWSDEYLSHIPEEKFRVKKGFQAVAGSKNSNDRSRALELYNMGLLRGPLVPAQKGNRNETPLGWQFLSDGEHIHTPLGYLANLIGHAREHSNSNEIKKGTSAIAALFAIQSHIVLKDGLRISYVSLFEWLKVNFPKPVATAKTIWLRYLATGMFSTIKDDTQGEKLVSLFLSSPSPVNIDLTFIWDNKTQAVDYQGFCDLLNTQPPLSEIKPRKHSLFWIGTDNDFRGLYSQAVLNCQDFLVEFGLTEAAILREKNGNPFEEIFYKNIKEETKDILTVLIKISIGIPSLTIQIFKLMQTLREGSIEAVRQLYGEDEVEQLKRVAAPLPLPIDIPHQNILFGPPGTGKSFKVENQTKGHIVSRTTFHPDADYTTFVGSYKPTSDKGIINYTFVPQIFAEIYLAAWKAPEKAHFLIIEEINRGNCAQIFGDLFQSLDRDEAGYSKYAAKANKDFANWINEQLDEDSKTKLDIETELRFRKLDGNEWITLPPNLYIWATMNTSDQSLYPMDSAFKRRWSWEYVPIDIEDANKVTIDLGEAGIYNWGTFIRIVNRKIYNLLQSEDKQIGNRFVNPHTDPRAIDINTFKSKVLFYLWSEIYKLETENEDSIFYYQPDLEGSAKERFTFGDLYEKDADLKILPSFMAALNDPTILDNN